MRHAVHLAHVGVVDATAHHAIEAAPLGPDANAVPNGPMAFTAPFAWRLGRCDLTP